ncbi:MAG: HAD-IA family hydrolase [Thermoleophilaceae bacterium]|nr:HAD-IA family hydrolase [Thermoleophilaceae bacterium]
MAIPKDIKWVTFDIYGTLIDWENGVYEAFKAEAERTDFALPDKNKVTEAFMRHQQAIKSGSYELYAEVLRRTALAVAEEFEWDLESSRSNFLPLSVERWKPFREANAALDRIAKKYKVGLVGNIDDKLLVMSRRHIRSDFDIVVTAQQVRSYKPELAHFKECQRRIGTKKDWIHVGSSYFYDVAPALANKLPAIWVNRKGEKLTSKEKKPTATVKNMRDVANILKA